MCRTACTEPQCLYKGALYFYLLHEFCAMSPLETLPPPGDPSGVVVYLQIVLSPDEASCVWMFLNINVLQGGFVSTSPNPQAGGPPLVGCPRLLIQYIRSYHPYWRPFLYPQPEDAPCRGDRDPLFMGTLPLPLPYFLLPFLIRCFPVEMLCSSLSSSSSRPRCNLMTQ